jgi:hypothetical protein
MEDLSLGSLCGVHTSRGEAWLTFPRITSYIQKKCAEIVIRDAVSYIYRILHYEEGD